MNMEIVPAAPAEEDASDDQRKTLQILILDDDEADRYRLRQICRKSGLNAEYEEAEDLQSFAAALDSKRYDAIFLDYNLGMDTGLDALKLVLDHDDQAKAIPIMVTSVGQHQMIVEAMRAGCADYLIKDELTVDGLRKSITGAMERRILLAALDRSRKLAPLNASLGRFLRSSAPELQAIMAEMMRRVWRIRATEGTSDDVKTEALSITRSCGDVLRYMDELKELADEVGAAENALPPAKG